MRTFWGCCRTNVVFQCRKKYLQLLWYSCNWHNSGNARFRFFVLDWTPGHMYFLPPSADSIEITFRAFTKKPSLRYFRILIENQTVLFPESRLWVQVRQFQNVSTTGLQTLNWSIFLLHYSNLVCNNLWISSMKGNHLPSLYVRLAGIVMGLAMAKMGKMGLIWVYLLKSLYRISVQEYIFSGSLQKYMLSLTYFERICQ